MNHIAPDGARLRESSEWDVRRDLAAVRTGRASTALIEHMGVDLYGQRMQLIQLANLAAPEAQPRPEGEHVHGHH